jgi:gliding motility-associated lipoprotein GldD
MRNWIFLLILGGTLISCKEEVLPKPKAYLSLEYRTAVYQQINDIEPYAFEASSNAVVIRQKNHWIQIKYPKLKASVNITYRPVQQNLKELLLEAEKLVFKHTLKAEKIETKDFEDAQKRVFGTLYEISGNAASQIQFHLTDSTTHFIKGALYFYTTPNYDSILPAVAYIKKDIVRLMETLEWR